jgi:site-specific DNA recombinase
MAIEEGLVVVYARYSTDRQDARSIEDQVRRCRAYAATRGYRVVEEYCDAAVSGAHVQRIDMQRLLAAARCKGGAPFRAVLVDDLSRLSRDLGNTWQIVFHDLAAADVRVIDVTTGMASDGAGARLTFGAMALVNDTFLQLVRTETHGGLEGRALGGFSTGGRCFGYATVEEDNPPDREHPRKRFVVETEQAAIVLRVFRLFAEGHALKKIAGLLNEEGIAAPNDGGRGNKNGRGWGHTTIRSMLRNERYVGRFTWNGSKWVRVADRKSRRRVKRPEAEWVTREYPELAIVPSALWQHVQARFRRVYATARGRPPATGRHVHLVSGLLRCGACGGSMTVVSRRTKASVSYARFGCTAHYSRGAAICANALSVSEKKVSRTLIQVLKEKLDRPDVVHRFVTTFRRRTAELRSAGGPSDDVDRRVRESEHRVANLTDALAKVGWSDALAVRLREEEAVLGRLKSERTARARTDSSRPMPDPAAISRYLTNLFTLLQTDTARGREILSRFVAPIVMTPETEGPARRYRATGAFNLSFVLTAASAEPWTGKSSCAGRI